jgi:hypothetical protein
LNKNHQGQNGRIEDKNKMNKRKYYFTLTLVVSILVGIILSFSLLPTPINLDWFFLVMALSFSLVWAIYSLILLGYVFLVEGRRNRNESKTIKEVDSSFLHSMQEWEALWKITVGRHKDPGMGNPDWN